MPGIARRNVRITFQKNAITSDTYRNRVQSWEDYFSCFAYAGTYETAESGDEVTYEERGITFSCRYCPELAAVTSTGYRIIFEEQTYDITSVDRMNYQMRDIKFRCVLSKRQEGAG